jgi:hypothetical protein
MAAGDLRQLADRQIVAPKRSRWFQPSLTPRKMYGVDLPNRPHSC